jgi:hypothetical protein
MKVLVCLTVVMMKFWIEVQEFYSPTFSCFLFCNYAILLRTVFLLLIFYACVLLSPLSSLESDTFHVVMECCLGCGLNPQPVVLVQDYT